MRKVNQTQSEVLALNQQIGILRAVVLTAVVAWPIAASAVSRSCTFGAVVSPDGRLIRGNASFVEKNLDLEGTYYVFFPYDVRQCAFAASIIGTGSTSRDVPAIVSVANALNAPRAIAVQIRTAMGTLVPRGFHVIVQCFG